MRLRPEQIARLDEWIASFPAPQPTRSEAVRLALQSVMPVRVSPQRR